MNVNDIRLTYTVGQVVPAENHIKADFLVLLRKIRKEAVWTHIVRHKDKWAHYVGAGSHRRTPLTA